MSGPAMNITTFPVERVLGAARWITSTNTRAASSFSSGEPLMRPSFRRVRAGPMPWGRVFGERGRRRRVFKRGGGGGGKEGGRGRGRERQKKYPNA